MSYQSKYTGQEIDELLDKVNAGGGEITSLYSGDKITIKGQTATLNDDITNYDAIVCKASVNGSGNATTSFVPFPATKTAYTISFYWDASVFYSLTYKFDNTRTISMHDKNGKSSGWEPIGIDAVYGIKLSRGINVSANPIGSIIPIMGKEAPQDYLVCDGSELNISEYSKLANYFEKQFGSKNYFGGDGTTTFAIPDLRDEFLRGYKGDNERQLSGEIGIHQDATEHKVFLLNNGTLYGYTQTPTVSDQANNVDTRINTLTNATSNYVKGSVSNSTAGTHYTARPTNVAVLFCIKYTESGSSTSSLGRACFGFKYSMVDGSTLATNDFLPVTKKFSNSIETDNQGNPILKAGKTYRVAVNIYRLNLSDGADNRFYLSRTINSNGDLELICAVHPVTRSKEWTAQNTTDYFDYIVPSEDFSLKFIAKHAENGQESSGTFINLMYFNVEIEEIA